MTKDFAIGAPMSSSRQKAKPTGALSRASGGLRVIAEPGTHIRLPLGNREVSATPWGADPEVASGRQDAKAGDARGGEVRLAGSTCEAGEQGGESRCRASGGKQRDQGKCGPYLEGNLKDLHERVHRGAYRALPSRRRYIPKPDGK